MIIKFSSTVILLIFIFSCTSKNKQMQEIKSPEIVRQVDPHTFAHPEEASVSHISLELTVDFQKQILSGHAKLNIKVSDDAKEIILDTRDLQIQKVLADNAETKFKLSDSATFMGRSLSIPITPNTKSVTIYYSTSPGAAALQWLNPEQTAGGKNPFRPTRFTHITQP